MQILWLVRLSRLRGLAIALLGLIAVWASLAGRAAPTILAAPHEVGLRSGSRPNPDLSSRPTIEPFVRPNLAWRMERLRPTILAAAARHNRPELSGMDERAFAAVIALVIYNENFGWLEDDIAPLRAFTPLYQGLQRTANASLPGSNFSVWPANLRPSVGLEILRHELPLADGRTITVPVQVEGSMIDPSAFADREALYVAITEEISSDEMAVAYLAANLERGIYRAAAEDVPVSWRTLAAWHNQGLVDPVAVRANPTARDYVRRASAFLPIARALVAPKPSKELGR